MRKTAAAFTALVLLCYPCPSWSQDRTATLIAICDQAAAPPLDQGRPTGVAGVALEKIDPKIAIPACDAAAKAGSHCPGSIEASTAVSIPLRLDGCSLSSVCSRYGRIDA
jgi:hypothetical protein